jgi:hypothetical protein
MSDFEGYSIVLRTVRGLNAAMSWTGKTHVIKALYVASTKAELPFEFVLFKHGPYSFDANDAIEQMSAVGLLSLTATPPYGVQLKPGQFESVLSEIVDPNTVEAIDLAVELVGNGGVQELEALATSIWVAKNLQPANDEVWSKEVKSLKPHLANDLISHGIHKAKKWCR